MFPPEQIESYLPEDPEPGQVQELPEGVFGGEVTTITILDLNNNILGESIQLTKVPNISGVWRLGRTYLSHEVGSLTDQLLRVRVATRKYTSFAFIEYLGWVGRHTTPEEVLSDAKYSVLESNSSFVIGKNIIMYDTIGIKKCKEQKK